VVDTDATRPESTGIESFAAGFSISAYLTVALAFGMLHGGRLDEIGMLRVLFLGLEFAAAGVTTAAVALAIGPHRGPASRPAWLAAGAALLLVLVAACWLLPRLFGSDSIL
jgi:hypothetical protein